jgi:hypothetical protein
MSKHKYICCEHVSVDYASKLPSPEHRIDLGKSTSLHLCEACYSHIYRKIGRDIFLRMYQDARKRLDNIFAFV